MLKWAEIDGPRVENPELSGFGFVLIDGQIEHQLGGKVNKAFSPDGLHLTIEFPKAIEGSKDVADFPETPDSHSGR